MLLSLSSAPPLEESAEFLFSSAGFDEVLPEDLPPSVPSVPFELPSPFAEPSLPVPAHWSSTASGTSAPHVSVTLPLVPA